MTEKIFIHTKQEGEPITLQEITEADIPDFIEMEKKLGGKTYLPWAAENDIREAMAGGKVMLIKDKDTIVGHVVCQMMNNKILSLSGLVIDPEYQNKGFARRAVEQVLLESKAYDIDATELTVHPENVRALNLYKSLGFEVIEEKENYYGDGEPRMVLRKTNVNA